MLDLNDAYAIAKYIKDAEKQTPVKSFRKQRRIYFNRGLQNYNGCYRSYKSSNNRYVC